MFVYVHVSTEILEETRAQKDQFLLYGYLMAYFISLYGHRPGVFKNMLITQVESASHAPDSHVINVSISLFFCFLIWARIGV